MREVNWGMSWPQIGTTQYRAQLGLQDKGRAIKGLVGYNNWDFGPAKRSGPRLLSNIPWGINVLQSTYKQTL